MMAYVDNEILRRTVIKVVGDGWGEIVGDAIRKIPGVAKVRAEEAAGRLEVEYDPSLTSPSQFKNAIHQAGWGKK
jgi:hypothetical protein